MLILCVLGSFAINNSTFDVLLMFLFGLLGYTFRKLEIPEAPILIAMALGSIAENNFRRAIIVSRGDEFVFFTNPLSLTFLLLAAILVFSGPIMNLIKKRMQSK